MRTAGDVPRKQLIIAAVAAGVTGVVLIALMSWRFSDGGWWAVVALRLTAWLAIGKVGFKVALGVLFGGAALVAWLGRRRRPPQEAEPGAVRPGDGDA
jgi:hypothetical protein